MFKIGLIIFIVLNNVFISFIWYLCGWTSIYEAATFLFDLVLVLCFYIAGL